MRRTTVTLSDDLAMLVEAEAKRRRTSVSEVVRESLKRSLLGNGKRSLPFAAICEDAEMTSGAEMEEALAEGWVDDLARRRR